MGQRQEIWVESLICYSVKADSWIFSYFDEVWEIQQFLPCDAMLARYMPSLCVCVCVCVYHTPVLYQKATRKITQIMPHNSPGTLVFGRQKYGEIRKGSPSTGATNAGTVD